MPTTKEMPQQQLATPADINHGIEKHIKKLEERFTQLKAQVRQAQQLASMGKLACTIAHEFKNGLSPVLSYAQAAINSDDPALQRKALEVTIKNVHMIESMALRVLEMSAAKAMDRDHAPLHPIIEDAAACLCRDVSKDGITFRNNVDDSVKVWVDRLQVQQVFFNLFLNAREAMAPQKAGLLKVWTENVDGFVRVFVKDTGPGIDTEVLGNIFDSFVTTKNGEREGTVRAGGLGLALCRDLVEENGGTIQVSSQPGTGTVFTIELPANSDVE